MIELNSFSKRNSLNLLIIRIYINFKNSNMKKSKLKKLAKLLHQQVTNYEKSLRPIREKINYNDYDPEVSEKVKSLILNIIQYKNNIHISFGDDFFSISTSDATQIKKQRIKNFLHSDEYFFEVSVQKEEGFTLNYGYSRKSSYYDKDIFGDMSTIVKNRLKEINDENFSDICESLMKDSGIMRDSNLEDLLNG